MVVACKPILFNIRYHFFLFLFDLYFPIVFKAPTFGLGQGALISVTCRLKSSSFNYVYAGKL